MEKHRTDRAQAVKLVWDWIWPALSIQALFAAFFAVSPEASSWPSLLSPTRVSLATFLLLVGAHLAYRMRYQRQLARLFFLFGVTWLLNTVFFAAGFAFLTCFLFRWPQDIGYGLLVLGGLVGVAYLTWRYYAPLLRELHERDTHTGRFDLEKGTFSLAIPPSLYEFRTPLLRKVMAILLPYSGVLVAISAASGIRGGSNLLTGRDVGTGVLFLFLASAFVVVMICGLYTYRWIRRWEKATGRTMWIKGFEPGTGQ